MSCHGFNLRGLVKVELNAYGNINTFVTKTKHFLFICGTNGYKLFYMNSKNIETIQEEFIKTKDISPYMKFSPGKPFVSNLLYTIYEGFGGLYNIDLNEQQNEKTLYQVRDPGILKAVKSYLENRIREDSKCIYAQTIIYYMNLDRGDNELSIHIGPINDTTYHVVLTNHSWEIIRFLLSNPDSVFYCNKDTRDIYPLLPSHKIRIVSH